MLKRAAIPECLAARVLARRRWWRLGRRRPGLADYALGTDAKKGRHGHVNQARHNNLMRESPGHFGHRAFGDLPCAVQGYGFAAPIGICGDRQSCKDRNYQAAKDVSEQHGASAPSFCNVDRRLCLPC